jgi:hypothetical protein
MATLDEMVATLAELQEKSVAINDGMDVVLVHIKELRDLIAAGGVVSQAQLDELFAQATAVKAELVTAAGEVETAKTA